MDAHESKYEDVLPHLINNNNKQHQQGVLQKPQIVRDLSLDVHRASMNSSPALAAPLSDSVVRDLNEPTIEIPAQAQKKELAQIVASKKLSTLPVKTPSNNNNKFCQQPQNINSSECAKPFKSQSTKTTNIYDKTSNNQAAENKRRFEVLFGQDNKKEENLPSYMRPTAASKAKTGPVGQQDVKKAGIIATSKKQQTINRPIASSPTTNKLIVDEKDLPSYMRPTKSSSRGNTPKPKDQNKGGLFF